MSYWIWFKTIYMKHFLAVFIFFSLCSLSAFAQTSPKPGLTPAQQERFNKMINSIEHPPAYYTLSEGTKWQYDKGMLKARSLKTKAWVLVVAGAALGGAGFLVPNKGDFTKPAFFAVGAAAIGTGIVCFHLVKKRKAQLALLLTGPPATPAATTTSFVRPQAGFRVSF